MILDIIKAAVPSEWVRTIALVVGVLWLGWVSNSAWGNIERHYTETTELVRISRQICKGIYLHGKLNPAPCFRSASREVQ